MIDFPQADVVGRPAMRFSLPFGAVLVGALLVQSPAAAQTGPGSEAADLEVRLVAGLRDLGYELALLEQRLESGGLGGRRREAVRHRLGEEIARFRELRRAVETEAPDAAGMGSVSAERLRGLLSRLGDRWASLRELEALLSPRDAVTRGGGTGSISGRLTDAITGQGVGGSLVFLHGIQIGTRSTTADVGGYFYFSGLDDGTYKAYFPGSPDHLGELYDDVPCGSFCDPDLGSGILVQGGAAVVGIDFELDKAAKILGRVTAAATGLGIAQVTVRGYDERGVQARWNLTDDDGYYEISGLFGGTFYLIAFPSGGYVPQLYQGLPCSSCDPTSGTPVVVAGGSVTEGIDFALEAGGAISGTVIEADSAAPLADVQIQVYDDRLFTVQNALTDGLGRYATTAGLEPGDYYVIAQPDAGHLPEIYDDIPCPPGCGATAGTPVNISGAGTVGGVDFALDRAAIISGRTFDADSGAGVVSVRVEVFAGTNAFLGHAFSQLSGHYEVGRLREGTRHVLAKQSGPYLGQLYDSLPCPWGSCLPNGGTPVAAPVGAVTGGIDFPLQRGGGISGTVVDGPSGTELPGVFVEIYRRGRSSALDSPVTDGLGRYATQTGLETEDYFAVAKPPLGDPHLEETYDDIADATAPQDGTPIAVVVGATTPGIDFALDRGGTLSGRVTAEDTGLPLSEVSVSLYDHEGRYRGWRRSNSQGLYEMPGLSPGTYFVRTQSAPVPYFDELFDGLPCEPSCDVTTGTPVAVSVNAATSGVDLSLTRGGMLLGRVLELGTGRPISGARVEVEGPGSFLSTYTSRFDGGFNSTGLQPGDYFVGVARVGYHGRRYTGLSCEGSCELGFAAPIPIALGASEFLMFSLYPAGLDPDLRISFETLCFEESIASCGTMTLGPELGLCSFTSFEAASAIRLEADVTIANGITLGNNPTLSCN